MNISSSKDVNLWRGCLGGKDKANFLTFIKAATGINVDSLVQYYLDYSQSVFKTKGKLQTVKFLKSLYGVALRYSAGVSFEPIPFLRANKDGLPSVLRTFRRLLKGSPDARRAALTVLQLYKLIESKAPHDLSSIVTPYKGVSDPLWLETFDEVVRQMFPPGELSNRKESLRGSLHISGKNGPNGPAMICTHIDRKSIVDTNLEQSIEKLASLTGNDQLIRIMRETDCMRDITVKHKTNRSLAHSRLRVKHESGGKARIFAILDILSQSALKPLHKFMMNWLKTQPTDGTNEHSIAAQAVREWTKTTEQIWSFDLTTATDRYPRFLEHRVVAAMFGEEIADLWQDIISNRSFLVPEGDQSVMFNVGQPLGALSSWAAFAITHHAHVQTAAKLAGHDLPFRDYRIIGDDISIYRYAAVAQQYIGMMNDLAVPFSTEKSILPHQCHPGNNVAELAKRVFTNGIEVTPVPPDAIIVYMRGPFGRRILIETGIQRGYTRLESPYTVQSFLNNEDFAAITFPLGRTLSLFKGVKVILSYWTDLTESPPAGLNRQWAFWELTNYAIPEYGFKWILKSYLNKEVNSAIGQGNQIREELYNSIWNGDFDTKGGDWNPGVSSLGQVMSLIITYMSQSYGETLYELSEQVEFETLDLYRCLAKLSSLIKPDDIFRIQNFLDEKTKTRVLASRLLKDALKISKEGINSFLEYTN